MISRIVSVDIGIRNLSLCILDACLHAPRIRHWETVDIITAQGRTAKNANKVSSRKLREYLWATLESRRLAFFDNIHPLQCHVAIEQQMSGKLTALETAVWGWFKGKGSQVTTLHARKKFQLSFAGGCTMGNYRENKKMAVTLCQKYIADHPTKYEQMFCDSKKKDDFADSLLQGLYLYEQIIRPISNPPVTPTPGAQCEAQCEPQPEDPIKSEAL